jgi:hypothetical protein
MEHIDIYQPQSDGLIKDVLTVGASPNTKFVYLWVNGTLYVQHVESYCPNYKEVFVAYKTSINQFDKDDTKFSIYNNQNSTDHINIESGDVVVVACPSHGYRATFIADKSFIVKSQMIKFAVDITVPMLLSRCINSYPADSLGKNLLKKQVREYADNALRKLTGAFVVLTAFTILVTSYYNAYKILTGN